jgi:hypothetical protein
MATNKFLHTGNIIIAGFACCVIGMSALVYGCLKQDVQMVTKNYYEKELQFQNDINAKTNANNYDKAFSSSIKSDSIFFNIPVNLSTQFTNGNITIYCASDMKQDKVIPIQSNASGAYSFSIKDWKKTSYLAKINITNNNQNYLKEISFQL